ncbi:hypothetical protein EI427_12820 [Flammeovirga pectinis]|uniref:DUF4595 domain-containing protein n=1 Tax=Flammeovirga pectinis TaxID=2494373 RepID=A0A3S9P4D8_9BACT|nr:hypothetical protein [Flammeovirga pectinis]AZQ63087.1 hypothetical protein EI427_12820 [Flammeovirga pectinis]
MKHFLYLLPFLFFFISCEKDESIPITQKNIVSIKYMNNVYGYQSTLSYNEKNQLNSYVTDFDNEDDGFTELSDYIYLENGQLNSYNRSRNSRYINNNSTIEYIYKENRVDIVTTDIENSTSYINTVILDNNILTESWSYLEDNSTISSKDVYTWDNGNPINIKSYTKINDEFVLGSEIEINYDNGINPYSFLKNSFSVRLSGESFNSVNNAVKISEKFYDSVYGNNSTQTYTISYAYDEDNYPTHYTYVMTQESDNPNTTPIIGGKKEFTYQ